MTVLCRLCRRPLDLAPSDGDVHLRCPHEGGSQVCTLRENYERARDEVSRHANNDRAQMERVIRAEAEVERLKRADDDANKFAIEASDLREENERLRTHIDRRAAGVDPLTQQLRERAEAAEAEVERLKRADDDATKFAIEASDLRKEVERLRELERLIDNPEEAKTRAIRAMRGYEAIQQQCATPVAFIRPDHLRHARTAPFLCYVAANKVHSDMVPLYAAPTFDAERAMELADEMAERYADKASLHVHYPTALTAYLEAREALRSYLEGKTT